MVYRLMDYWPIFDTIASYGHILNNITIVVIAINLNVSVLMLFNVVCVCLFYMMATQKLNKKADKNFKESGLNSQCDLKLASLITKRYKKESFESFLRLRRTIWHVQFAALCFLICLGYPTELLYSIRGKLEADPE